MIHHAEISKLPLDPFIEGRRRPIANATTHPTFDPATGAVLCDVPVCDESVVDEAVTSARKALKGQWATVLPAERARILQRVAKLIRGDAARLATIESPRQREAAERGKRGYRDLSALL